LEQTETIQTNDAAGESACRTSLYTVARIVSRIMHPFLMPVYALLLIVFGNTMLDIYPTRIKIFFFAVVVLNAVIIPAFAIALMRTLGYITDISLDNRRDRISPLALMAISYGICIMLVTDIQSAFLIRKFLIAGMACSVLALIITFFWKISLHLVAAGAVTAMIAMLAVAGIPGMFIPLITCILLTGILASARLLLGKHTPAQVGLGFLAGFTASALALLFLG
jgi:hypothetical protein